MAVPVVADAQVIQILHAADGGQIHRQTRHVQIHQRLPHSLRQRLNARDAGVPADIQRMDARQVA